MYGLKIINIIPNPDSIKGSPYQYKVMIQNIKGEIKTAWAKRSQLEAWIQATNQQKEYSPFYLDLLLQ